MRHTLTLTDVTLGPTAVPVATASSGYAFKQLLILVNHAGDGSLASVTYEVQSGGGCNRFASLAEAVDLYNTLSP